MAYATEAALALRYGQTEIDQLADKDNDGTPDTGAVQGALDDASDEIDSYIGGRYPLPLTAPYPDRLVLVCSEIARYRLFDDKPTDEVRKRYEDCIKWLKDVRDGKADIPITVEADNGSVVSVVARDQVYTPTVMGMRKWP